MTTTPAWDELAPASPGGQSVAYTRRRSGGESAALWTMQLDGTGRRRLTGRDATEPAWAPDGRTIYFSRYLLQRSGG